jgi:glyoxalase family protein
MQLSGLHHVTAITARAPENHAFYTGLLGMRLVKKTVNQDDTSAYHLFYADGLASPGSDLTFFDWPAPPERRGTRAVVRTGLRVAGAEALAWWLSRFEERGVRHAGIVERDGRASLDFEDPEGQRLTLVDDGGAGDAHPWAHSPVPEKHQIRGLGHVMLSVPDRVPTEAVLRTVLGMRATRSYGEADGTAVHVYETGEGGQPDREVHLRIEPHLSPAGQGAGAVHHIAFRTPDEEQYREWAARLRAARLPSSGPVDRFYFRSLYFREPNGILIEIATDGPGFVTDEPLEHLGERLSLPPFLEGRRAEIERGLKPLSTG